jgi:hypothetical protein
MSADVLRAAFLSSTFCVSMRGAQFLQGLEALGVRLPRSKFEAFVYNLVAVDLYCQGFLTQEQARYEAERLCRNVVQLRTVNSDVWKESLESLHRVMSSVTREICGSTRQGIIGFLGEVSDAPLSYNDSNEFHHTDDDEVDEYGDWCEPCDLPEESFARQLVLPQLVSRGLMTMEDAWALLCGFMQGTGALCDEYQGMMAEILDDLGLEKWPSFELGH